MWGLINTDQAQNFLLRELAHHQIAARKFGMQIADPKLMISIFSIQHGEEDKVTNTLQSNHLAYSLFYNEKKIVILTFFHTNTISLHIHQSIVYRGQKKRTAITK